MSVPPRLRQHPSRRIDEQHGEISGRRSGGHVARVLFVAWRVSHDEAATFGREIAVGHVDGDALLTLCHQAVDGQREIDSVVRRSELLRIGDEVCNLVVEQLPGVMKQSADQRRLAIVDAAADQHTERGLVADVVAGDRRHQKYPSRFFVSMPPISSRSIARP